MDISEFFTTSSVVASGIGILASGVAASWNFYEKAMESKRSRRQSRQIEILRLQHKLGDVSDTFSEIFDYQSELDKHLRIVDLMFTAEEAKTRTRVDIAFEHLRDIHRSVTLGLIKKEDIGPWVYWIHRAQTREPIQRYASACGYGAFLDDLNTWMQSSQELVHLKKCCPWL